MRSTVRWLVPVTVATVVAGGAMINSAAAGSTPVLPVRTAQQVLEAVAGSNVTALSGTVVTNADLGLPALSQLAGGSGGSGAPTTDVQGLITRFLTGANTLRVWADGPTRQRAQLLDAFDELNVVRNGDEVWTYASRQNTAQHGVLPQHKTQPPGTTASGTTASGAKPSGVLPSGAQDLTPAQLAQQALTAVGPTTEVTLGTPELVAGRPAYALTLTPRSTATLVDHVVIAVDAAKSVPLQVQVFARGNTKAAIESGFTAVDFSTPSAAEFTFTPPKGATVTQLGADTSAHPGSSASGSSAPDSGAPGSQTPSSKPSGTAAKPTVTGAGWTSIVDLPSSGTFTGLNSPGPGTAAERGSATGRSAIDLLGQLTTPVTGGRAITSSLLSVLITDDGRVFAGSVPVQALVDAAKK